jgi:hypothetical protein
MKSLLSEIESQGGIAPQGETQMSEPNQRAVDLII